MENWASSVASDDFAISWREPGADVAKPRRDDLYEIDHLQKEAERYRSEACGAAIEDRRKHLTLMAKLSETMVSNEKMRAWLDEAISQLGRCLGCAHEYVGQLLRSRRAGRSTSQF